MAPLIMAMNESGARSADLSLHLTFTADGTVTN